MPTRMLHEKICDSVTLAELTAEEERLFHRLVVKADDYGRFHAIPSLLLGACFPLLIEKIEVEQVRAWRDRLAEVGLIALYTVDGREYLQIVTWEAYQRQRGSRPKFPAPLEGAEIRGELPQAADICGSRVVKTGYPVDVLPEDDSRKTVDDARKPRAADAANGADAPPTAKSEPKKASKSPGKTSPPESFEPNEADYAAARDVGLGKAEAESKVGAMLDYFRAKGEQRADWHATFRTWVRNSVKFDQPSRASPTNGHAEFAHAPSSGAPVSYLYDESLGSNDAT